MSFKSGDYVRCVDDCNKQLVLGAVYCVVSISEFGLETHDRNCWHKCRFEPWTPREGDWITSTAGIAPNPEIALGKQTGENSFECAAPGHQNVGVKFTPGNKWVPVLGRAPQKNTVSEILDDCAREMLSGAPAVTKPRGGLTHAVMFDELHREFRIGDVVECLPDQERSDRQYGLIAKIVRIETGGRHVAHLNEGLYNWPVRSLILIKAVEGGEILNRTGGRDAPENPHSTAIDPDAEFWRRHNESVMARNFPPLDINGRPLQKIEPPPKSLLWLGHAEDWRGMQIREEERDARKYAGWRGE